MVVPCFQTAENLIWDMYGKGSIGHIIFIKLLENGAIKSLEFLNMEMKTNVRRNYSKRNYWRHKIA